MGEKLTPLTAHLTRSGVPVYLVNSRSHTQVADRVFMARAVIRVDLGIVRSRRPGWRTSARGQCPSQQRLSLVRGHRSEPQHLPRHAGILEEIIAGRVVGVASVGLRCWTSRMPPAGRPYGARRFGPASAVFAGCNGIAAAVANSTCCSVINTGVRGDASAPRCSTASRAAPNGARNSDISVPPVSVDLPGRWTRLSDGRNLRPVISDPHE